MKIPMIHCCSDYVFTIKNNPLTYLSSQNKKIALIALTVFCALIIGYYFISSFFQAKKKESLVEQEDERVQRQFDEQVHQKKNSLNSEDELIKEEGFNDQEIKLEEINIIQDSQDHLSTSYRAHIALISRDGLLAGPELEDRIEDFDFYEWKFLNGDDLPVKEDTLLLKFILFFPTEELKQLDNVSFSHFYLPSFLFIDKKEGDMLYLKYKGKVVQLQINQGEITQSRSRNKKEKIHFEDVFTCTVDNALKEIDTGKYGFSGSLYGYANLFEGYTLDFGGALYHFNQKNCKELNVESCVVQADAKDFRQVKKAEFGNFDIDKVTTFESKTDMCFQIAMSGIGDQVDIVLNEKFLCFYAREELSIPGFQSPATHQVGVSMPSFQKATKGATISAAYLRIVRWKLYFENLSLEEMQERIKHSKVTLADGIFNIIISK